jgi:hypothetical protein
VSCGAIVTVRAKDNPEQRLGVVLFKWVGFSGERVNGFFVHANALLT